MSVATFFDTRDGALVLLLYKVQEKKRLQERKFPEENNDRHV
jgi:hypothetical protein